jgi:hypothetical protein
MNALSMEKLRYSIGEEAPLGENELALSLTELSQSMTALSFTKLPGVSRRSGSAAEKQARSFVD